MGFWASRGLRGSTLEQLINITNNSYKDKNLGIIQKIPTPITPISIDKEKGLINKAYFDQKSTVDYIGVVQGVAICFEAKDTKRQSLPIQNIHSHQIDFMYNFQKQQGVSFLIVNFSLYNETYFLPFDVLKFYWDDSQGDGRKSIPYSAFDKEYLIYSKDGFLLHYLEPLSKFLEKQ